MGVSSYFLGGNTCEGFYSCYQNFCNQEKEFLYVIKGGPGCGKSSFMRKIGAAAENSGYSVEYVLCSGDPGSLDGVRIPDLHIAYMDGTAPHIADPLYPGVCGAYLDLGAYYDMDALYAKRNRLMEKYKEYKKNYRAAYEYLALQKSEEECDESKEITRFLSAITCQGFIDLADSASCSTVTKEVLIKLLSDPAAQWAERHPLWPNQIVGVMIGGKHYRISKRMPDISKAIEYLKQAKSVHDELEALYNPHTDFAGIYATANNHIKKYIEKPL